MGDLKFKIFRTQDKNRADALARLQLIIETVTTVQKSRRPTKATKGSQRRRMDKKTQRGQTKALRGKVSE